MILDWLIATDVDSIASARMVASVGCATTVCYMWRWADKGEGLGNTADQVGEWVLQ